MTMTALLRPVPDVGAQMRLDDDGGIPVPDPVTGESAPNATAQVRNPPSHTGATAVVPALPNRPAGEPPEPATDHPQTSVGWRRAH